MSVMISNDKKELILTCKCGCEDALHLMLDDEDAAFDEYMVMTYLNGNWYRDQNDGAFKSIWRKLKKIWSIIRNKDFYYSEICMDKKDFQAFKEYINQF